MTDDTQITESSGNVFRDLGLPHPDELLVKAELMRRITALLVERGMTQAKAAEVLHTTQPIVSNLKQGRISGFSLERLIRFLNALDQNVEISVRSKPPGGGAGTIAISGELGEVRARPCSRPGG